jgi:hypothetical protein
VDECRGSHEQQVIVILVDPGEAAFCRLKMLFQQLCVAGAPPAL